jgi:starch synthase
MSEEKRPKTKKDTPTPLSTNTGRAKLGTRTPSRAPVTPGQEQAPEPVEPAKPATRARKTSAAPKARAKKQPGRGSVVAGSVKAEQSVSDATPSQAAGQAQRLSIVMIASEAHPFAKTGGLAEVAGALPDALARLGHSVTVVLPKYRGVSLANARTSELSVPLGAHPRHVTVQEGALGDNVTIALLDPDGLFDREGLYGTLAGDYPDNAWRFALFSRAALEYLRARGERPSVIHTHDWQTGLVPVYQKMQLSDDPVVGGVPVVFTIHNLAFQGLFPPSNLPEIGLGWEMLNIQAMEYWGQISYLKGGINFSEKITTVSPKYAREIVQPELGFGFDGVLARRAADLVGILNGIDTDRWNPERDEFVPAKFSAEDLDAKDGARRVLLEAVSLPSAADEKGRRRPVIGLISRLTDQKGFDLIAAASEPLMALDATWVMLGSGDPRYEALWRSLAERHPDRVSATIGFDERLAHLIEAGADIFVMPSRFEPCGLNQMYSLRYGTVPVVRATGGLDDTVQDVDEASGTGTGFKFREYTPGALVSAVERAIAVFQNPTRWRRIQQAGMHQEVSWDASAREYVKVYRALLGG